VEPELIEGGKGDFNVTVGNDLIFSKKKEDRFPEEKEILDALRKR
jgi:selT/selW/selH-like putative selenoprotein